MDDLIHHRHSVRRLYRPDLAKFREHLIRLDPETRHDRFGLQVSDDYLGNYADLCFEPGAVTYGYFEDGVIRGASELRMFPSKDTPSHKDAEAAFSVERPWRRREIGTALMGHIVLAARNRRIDTLTIFCLRHNQAMLSLARKFEADLKFEHNDVTGHLVARAPNVLSLWREFVDNTLDLGAAVLDYQGRMIKGREHTLALEPPVARRAGVQATVTAARVPPSRLIVARAQPIVPERGRSSMAERKLPKLHTRVRFPSPAPVCFVPRHGPYQRIRVIQSGISDSSPALMVDIVASAKTWEAVACL